ncbi:MAG: hypothetical protein DME46_03715 [Verrucomicrobia bacterium]|nr:MAG: hypothetical protein DME46_03715 [Verrucomicrobiota bacterium]
MSDDFSEALDKALRIALDAVQRQQAIDLAAYAANTSRSLEATRAGNAAGTEALRAVTLLNGGAAVALLAFIGHLASIGAPQSAIRVLREPLTWFVVGAFLAVAASAITYFAQGFTIRSLKHEFDSLDEEKPKEKRENARRRMGRSKLGFGIVNSFAVVFGVMALCAFVGGGCKAYRAFDERIGPSITERATIY